MKEQYKCSNCKWVGDKSELDTDGFNCPECGGAVNVGYQLSKPEVKYENKRKCCYCGNTSKGENNKKTMFATIYGGGADTIGWIYNCINTLECIDRVRADYAGRKGDSI